MKAELVTAKVVAKNIREVREYRKYSQDYLAAKLSISQNAYSKIELGYSRITLDRLFSIAIILEIEVRRLISLDPTTALELNPPSS